MNQPLVVKESNVSYTQSYPLNQNRMRQHPPTHNQHKLLYDGLIHYSWLVDYRYHVVRFSCWLRVIYHEYDNFHYYPIRWFCIGHGCWKSLLIGQFQVNKQERRNHSGEAEQQFWGALENNFWTHIIKQNPNFQRRSTTLGESNRHLMKTFFSTNNVDMEISSYQIAWPITNQHLYRGKGSRFSLRLLAFQNHHHRFKINEFWHCYWPT